ncbi:MAG: hypothetical protein IPP29_20250 [Bacteroidetes bacterium]|nr:hypothetical protein [Bacteroidota bacterium]
MFLGNLFTVGIDNFTDHRSVIIKTDLSGNRNWVVGLTGGCVRVTINDLIETKNGELFIVGDIQDTINACQGNYYNCMLARLDTNNGQILFSKTFGYDRGSSLNSIFEDNNGKIVVGGYDNISYVDHNTYAIIIKFDIQLNIIWKKAFTLYYPGLINNIAVDSFNNIYACGSIAQDTILETMFLLKN